jgi:hypothetical protein
MSMTTQESKGQRPHFAMPVGYRWLIDRGLVGFEPNSALQPWYLLSDDQMFFVSDRWPRSEESSRLYAFARRQDCDDLACFVMKDDISQPGIAVIHGWTPDGYEVAARYESIWEWLQGVMRDIEEWVALGEE